MNKADIINAVSELTNCSKYESEKAVAAILEVITRSLANGEQVKIVGFGSFRIKEQDSRKWHNPSTGEEITIPASRAVVFKAGKTLKERVSNN